MEPDLIINRTLQSSLLKDPSLKHQGFMLSDRVLDNENFLQALKTRNYNDRQIAHLEFLYKYRMQYVNRTTWAFVTSFADGDNVFLTDYCKNHYGKGANRPLTHQKKFNLLDENTNLGYTRWIDKTTGEPYHMVQVVDDLDTDESAEAGSEIWFFGGV